MGNIFIRGSDVEPLEFKNQHEAFKRYLTVIFISSALITIAILTNLVSYLVLIKEFRADNYTYSIWFTVTTFLSISLLVLAILLYILPSIPRSRTKKEDLLFHRDFIKIVQESFKPTENKYKIIGIINSFSYLIGIPIYLANLVLIFVGLFIYYFPM